MIIAAQLLESFGIDGDLHKVFEALGPAIRNMPGVVVPDVSPLADAGGSSNSSESSDSGTSPIAVSSSGSDELYRHQRCFGDETSDSDSASLSTPRSRTGDDGWASFSSAPPADAGRGVTQPFTGPRQGLVFTTRNGKTGYYEDLAPQVFGANARGSGWPVTRVDVAPPAEAGQSDSEAMAIYPAPQYHLASFAEEGKYWKVSCCHLGGPDAETQVVTIKKATAKVMAAELATRLGLAAQTAYLAWNMDDGKKLVPLSPLRKAVGFDKVSNPILLAAQLQKGTASTTGWARAADAS